MHSGTSIIEEMGSHVNFAPAPNLSAVRLLMTFKKTKKTLERRDIFL